MSTTAVKNQDTNTKDKGTVANVDHEQHRHLLDPLQQLIDPFAAFTDLLEFGSRSTNSVHPIRMDIVSKDNEVVINAEVPGCNKDDLHISLDGDMLTVSGEKKSKFEEKGTNFLRREISYGSTSRSVRLPEGCETSNVKASFTDGVLNINIPRKSVDKQAKKQDIRIE